jgi:hypothetical protein
MLRLCRNAASYRQVTDKLKRRRDDVPAVWKGKRKNEIYNFNNRDFDLRGCAIAYL